MPPVDLVSLLGGGSRSAAVSELAGEKAGCVHAVTAYYAFAACKRDLDLKIILCFKSIMTHLAHALLALRERRQQTFTAIAQMAGLTQPLLSKLVGHGTRPDIKTLCALCSSTAPRDGLELLLAHLRDEVERAGRLQSEVQIEADTRKMAGDIRLLEEEAQTDKELRAILHDLAELVRKIRRKYPVQTDDDQALAAED